MNKDLIMRLLVILAGKASESEIEAARGELYALLPIEEEPTEWVTMDVVGECDIALGRRVVLSDHTLDNPFEVEWISDDRTLVGIRSTQLVHFSRTLSMSRLLTLTQTILWRKN